MAVEHVGEEHPAVTNHGAIDVELVEVLSVNDSVACLFTDARDAGSCVVVAWGSICDVGGFALAIVGVAGRRGALVAGVFAAHAFAKVNLPADAFHADATA